MSAHGSPAAPTEKRWKIPLHFKLLASYLLVVCSVFVPTFIYLKAVFRNELRQSTLHGLEMECDQLALRLSNVPPEHFPETASLILQVMPARVTIFDAQGRVLRESAKVGLPDRGERPEIEGALLHGSGTSERMSAAMHEVLLYAARRFPLVGAPRGVVRLSISMRQIDEAMDDSFSFVTRAGAVALSAAVLFSMLAAFVVSRPLQRLARAARSFTEGDLGHRIDVTSNDELGDVALSLRELGAHLRGTLLAAGADRATLQALLDDLPCGVIIFDSEKEPILISGAARELCALSGTDDFQRARQIAELPAQADAIARVLEARKPPAHLQARWTSLDAVAGQTPSSLLVRDKPGSYGNVEVQRVRQIADQPAQAEAILRVLEERKALTLDLDLPWHPSALLEARWVSLHAPNGQPRPALVVRDKGPEERSRRMSVALRRAAESLRRAAKTVPDVNLSADLERHADDAQTAGFRTSPAVAGIASIEVGQLCTEALTDLRSQLKRTGMRIEIDLVEPAVQVVEVDGLSHQAVRRLVVGALGAANGANVLRLRGELADSMVRLSFRTEGKKIKIGGLAELVHCIGGDAGTDREGEASEAWLTLPRA